MEKNEVQIQIQTQVQRWLSRKTTTGSVRQVTGLPIALASDVGIVRSENQDRLVLLRAQVTNEKSFLVGVLCDGMGGMINGKECAELAISFFISSCIVNRQMRLKDRLLNAVNSANNAIYEKYHGDGGTTLSAFILDSDKQIEVINVGDSRIYLTTDMGFEQITTDDTVAGQLKNNFHTPEVSGLLQYIGIGPSLEPHFIELPHIDKISKLLMTSDGSHYIVQETLKRIMMPALPASELAERLINVAKWCGGHDNASALLLTDLPSLFLKTENVYKGTIDIWDSFGEMQLFGVETASPKKTQVISDVSVGPKGDINASVISNTSVLLKDEEPSKNSDNLDDKIKPRKMRQKKETKKEPEQPNLRIDFE